MVKGTTVITNTEPANDLSDEKESMLAENSFPKGNLGFECEIESKSETGSHEPYKQEVLLMGVENPEGISDEEVEKLRNRLKQIRWGKNTRGYQAYLTLVPKGARGDDPEIFPKTPTGSLKGGSRNFVRNLSTWRKNLHNWDEGYPWGEDDMESYNPVHQRTKIWLEEQAREISEEKQNENGEGQSEQSSGDGIILSRNSIADSSSFESEIQINMIRGSDENQDENQSITSEEAAQIQVRPEHHVSIMEAYNRMQQRMLEAQRALQIPTIQYGEVPLMIMPNPENEITPQISWSERGPQENLELVVVPNEDFGQNRDQPQIVMEMPQENRMVRMQVDGDSQGESMDADLEIKMNSDQEGEYQMHEENPRMEEAQNMQMDAHQNEQKVLEKILDMQEMQENWQKVANEDIRKQIGQMHFELKGQTDEHHKWFFEYEERFEGIRWTLIEHQNKFEEIEQRIMEIQHNLVHCQGMNGKLLQQEGNMQSMEEKLEACMKCIGQLQEMLLSNHLAKPEGTNPEIIKQFCTTLQEQNQILVQEVKSCKTQMEIIPLLSQQNLELHTSLMQMSSKMAEMEHALNQVGKMKVENQGRSDLTKANMQLMEKLMEMENKINQLEAKSQSRGDHLANPQ
jgi:hypothetical protein